MSVPAHAERDYEFAKKYNISIKQVISKDKNTNEGAIVSMAASEVSMALHSSIKACTAGLSLPASSAKGCSAAIAK
jgi:leucyl-tRNA synthetase